MKINTGKGTIPLTALVAIWSISAIISLPGLAISPILEDLDKIWELRYWIPDPNKLEYANCECAPTSRFRG